MCYLLEKLPPELRNRVYRLILCSPAYIAVTKAGHERPGLVSTCKLIRSEALAIFYAENTFYFDVGDFDGKCTVLFYKNAPKITLGGVTMPGHEYLIPNWSNLLSWLKATYEDKTAVILQRPEDIIERSLPAVAQTEHLVVSAMFNSVKALRKLPWKEVKDVVTMQRYVLITLDWRWGED